MNIFFFPTSNWSRIKWSPCETWPSNVFESLERATPNQHKSLCLRRSKHGVVGTTSSSIALIFFPYRNYETCSTFAGTRRRKRGSDRLNDDIYVRYAYYDYLGPTSRRHVSRVMICFPTPRTTIVHFRRTKHNR